MKHPAFNILCLLLLVVGLSGCKKTRVVDAKQLLAQPFGKHSCAACSMIIREQSAPRAQVIHRDGKRQYFCSISDMLSYIEAPSPHGKVIAIHVETLAPKSDPRQFDPKARPWLAAKEAFFVLGVKKPRVMGVPVLVYRHRKSAVQVAKTYKAKVFDWRALKPAWRAIRNH